MREKKVMRRLAVLVGLVLSLGAQGILAAEASHDHGGAAASLHLNQGQKWATDAPLRQGMAHIGDAMDGAMRDIHEGTLTASQYAALAKNLQGEVEFIVGNCKLDAQADAQLHLVIADIASGVEAMQDKQEQSKRRDGAGKVTAALENYATYFSHPGWKAAAH